MALTTTSATAPTMATTHRPSLRGDRHLFSASDDAIVMKQIQGTHTPDGRDFDVKPLMRVVEDGLRRASPTAVITQHASVELLEDKGHQVESIELLSFTIHRIASEISYKCSGSGNDAHATTVGILHLLSTFDWDAKVVLVMAALANNYGQFGLTAQLHAVNPLAKSIATLKQLPELLEHIEVLRPRLDAVNNLIKALIDVTWCIIEFNELPPEHMGAETPEMQVAVTHIPTAVYWTIRSIIACESQITGLIGLGHDYISATTEAWELSSLAHKVNNIQGHLTKQLDHCRRNIKEKQHWEAFQALERLFDTTHIDNMKILRALFYSKDEHPLIDGVTKKRVSVELLRRKIVMLFISDLDISHEELFVLVQIYNETHHGGQALERRYEVVWLPIIDRHHPWDLTKEERYNRLASDMPWYYPNNPSMIDPAVVRYVRQAWRFDKKPLMVVLDPQGKVVCPNALHMMWIWGSLAFPFTSIREEALWKEEIWRLDLLVDEIDPAIVQAIRDERYICLYGGEDVNWIKQFTSLLRRIAQEVRIPLEMVYVGKSNPKERIKKVINMISTEKLSGYWQDTAMVWFFWVRLESMLHSKMQLHDKSYGIPRHNHNHGAIVPGNFGHSAIVPGNPGHGAIVPGNPHSGHEVPNGLENDQILLEVMSLLSYDSGGHPWAVIAHGSLDLVRYDGRKLLECLGQFETWKDRVEFEGFLPALRGALEPYHTHEHCTRLILPGDAGRIKERVVCAECKKPMEKFVLYQCCND
ncbi:sieve element occlusion protein [Rhynchospora pubera]|uniref:Sieve element occlusion protein n=1 Tax=Rhynchospora pubera TaxID=906938 RepID=A0AAV8CQI2_9POAL|nr:sieve element occlusion protein [Rhynchospora pubera]